MEPYDVVELLREEVRLHSEGKADSVCPELAGARVSEATEVGFLLTMKNGQQFSLLVAEVK